MLISIIDKLDKQERKEKRAAAISMPLVQEPMRE